MIHLICCLSTVAFLSPYIRNGALLAVSLFGTQPGHLPAQVPPPITANDAPINRVSALKTKKKTKKLKPSAGNAWVTRFLPGVASGVALGFLLLKVFGGRRAAAGAEDNDDEEEVDDDNEVRERRTVWSALRATLTDAAAAAGRSVGRDIPAQPG